MKAECYAAFKGPRPFHFQTEKRVERKQPLLYMDVNLGPGKTGRIGLHAGDDPGQLSLNFAKTYGLDATMRGRLQQLIERYMDEVCRLWVANAGKYLPPEVAANGLKVHRIGHGCVRHARL